MKELDNDTIAQLLKPDTPTPRVSNQKGPLRWYDIQHRCATRMCSSPTYIKIDGIPRCIPHALAELNQIILNLEAHGYYHTKDKEGNGLDDLPGTL